MQSVKNERKKNGAKLNFLDSEGKRKIETEKERERKWKGDEGQTLWVSAQSSGIKYYVWYLMLKMNQGEAKGHRRS